MIKIKAILVFFLSLWTATVSFSGHCDFIETDNLKDSEYFNSAHSAAWTEMDKAEASGGIKEAALRWALRDGQRQQIIWKGLKGTEVIDGDFYVTDVKKGSKPVKVKGVFKRSEEKLLFASEMKELGIVFDAVFIPRADFIEVIGKIKDTTGQDRALRVEYSLKLDASGWMWWDDIRNARRIEDGEQYSNTTPVFVGSTGQMSKYPFSCISSNDKALSYGVPLNYPRVFQISYDDKTKKYVMAFDFAVSKKTEKFPGEATFFFVFYSPKEAGWGFRSAAGDYYGIYPENFKKRVKREGIWMPFTSISSVENPQDFYFAFHEFGSVDLRYNNAHGVYSFRYVEPWTYWMAMEPNVPREYGKAIELLKEGVTSNDAERRKMSQATLLSGMYNSGGKLSHKFENTPWCNGVVFYENSDPDIPHEGELKYNRADICFEIAKKEIIDRKISVLDGWDNYGEGFEIDAAVFRSITNSLVIDRPVIGSDFGARQVVVLNQTKPRPIIFGGYSKALNVTGSQDADYSLYVDILYDDSTYSWGHTATFDAGTHDWQYRQKIIYPDKPVKQAAFHILFRGNHTGKVWFDDVFLKELKDEEIEKAKKQVWDKYFKGFELDIENIHSGKQSILINKIESAGTYGARQRIEINQEKASPLKFAGWSKADDVKGASNSDYSLYADMVYADGSPLYGVTANFDAGTHDWQYKEIVLEPEKPVKTIMFHVLFRGDHTGKVWFDDISIINAETGEEFILDGGFEEVLKEESNELGKDSANMIINFDFEDGFSGLIVDGIYLDSLEGWAKERNYRQEHFRYADIPLVFDQRTKEPVVLNAFSIYEFTKAISDYMHKNGKLTMANWVTIDFPFYTALLDAPGKEVHWLGWEDIYKPDEDEVMSYRRTLSYQKPYLLLLNVHFDRFTFDMMDKYFQRCLFYGMFPSMFSYDAATDPYFQNPSYYNRDRALFIKYLPIIKKISSSGWEPLSFAYSSNDNIFVERYGAKASDALYFTVHNNLDFNQKGTIDIKKKELGLTEKVNIDEVLSNTGITYKDTEELLSFPVSMEGYQTKVFRVTGTDFRSLSVVAAEGLNDILDIIRKYEEQKKITPAELTEHGEMVLELLKGISSEEFVANAEALEEKTSKLNKWAADKGQDELLNKMLRCVRSISNLRSSLSKVKFDLKAADALVSPSANTYELSFFNDSAEVVSLERLLLNFSPALNIAPLDQDMGMETVPVGGKVVRTINFTVPEGLKEGAEGAVDIIMAYRKGGVKMNATNSVLVKIVKDIEFKLDPLKLRTFNDSPSFKVFIHNNCNTPVKGVLSVEASGECEPSLKDEEVEVKSGETECIMFDISCPAIDKRQDFTFKVSFNATGREKRRQEGLISFFPKRKNLLLQPGVAVKVDSTYAGYKTDPLYDGIVDTEGFAWNESAWASEEIATPHWIEIMFPEAVSISSVVIYWADDQGRYWVSDKYKIEAWKKGKWMVLSKMQGSNTAENISKHVFDSVVTDRIRIWQDYGGGPKDRLDLMWIKEIEVLP